MRTVILLSLLLVAVLQAKAQIQGQAQAQAQRQRTSAISVANSNPTSSVSSNPTSSVSSNPAASVVNKHSVASAVAAPGNPGGGYYQCTVGVGVAAQFVGVGGGISAVAVDKDCVRFQSANLALNLNYRGHGEVMAHGILCGGEDYRRGAMLAGVPCPLTAQSNTSHHSEARPELR